MGDAYIAIDAKMLGQKIEAMMEEYPELADDDALRADTLEGSTDIHAVASRILSHIREAEQMVEGCKRIAADLSERQARWGSRIQFGRELLLSIMDSANQAAITLPEATISVSPGKESVDVTDIDIIPQGYYRVKKEADKTAIAKSFKKGEPVPGAAMKMGEPTIRINTK